MLDMDFEPNNFGKDVTIGCEKNKFVLTSAVPSRLGGLKVRDYELRCDEDRIMNCADFENYLNELVNVGLHF